MKTSTVILLVVSVLVVSLLAYLFLRTTPVPTASPTPTATLIPVPTATLNHDNLIRVSNPLPDAVIKSPLTIIGQARGTWYFEASFPAKMYDDYGRLLGAVPVQAQGEWMTENFVPFKTIFSFATPSTNTGKLVIEKDNPSGLPQNADQIEIPVRFDLLAFPQRTINLYYYNPNKDKDSSGNIMCSRQGLVSVQREIPSTIVPIQDAIQLLLQGSLTDTEKSQGLTTEYPLAGLTLISASVNNGTLTLTFSDPNNKTSGGSCRVGVLWSQIEATAKQFSGISSVKFLPEELFQP